MEYRGIKITENESGKFIVKEKSFHHLIFAKEYVDFMFRIKDAYQDIDGIYRWKSNNHIPFNDMLETWGLSKDEIQKHEEARNKDTDSFLSEYRKQMKNHVPSNEEMYEMRAAFGEGTTIVNVITGKKIKL